LPSLDAKGDHPRYFIGGDHKGGPKEAGVLCQRRRILQALGFQKRDAPPIRRHLDSLRQDLVRQDGEGAEIRTSGVAKRPGIVQARLPVLA
jgi:hypothetical protein